MSRIFEFKKTTFIPCSIDEAWAFFSNPHNLKRITPPEMNFKIVSDTENKTYAGQIIQYKVTPLFGITMSWTTLISTCKPPYFFVDEQVEGPYHFWHHQHLFCPKDGGVEMTDILHYGLPFSFFLMKC